MISSDLLKMFADKYNKTLYDIMADMAQYFIDAEFTMNTPFGSVTFNFGNSVTDKRKELIKSLWHDSSVKPDPERCIFAYNAETDDCDIIYANVVGNGYKWIYLEDFLLPEQIERLKRHERELEEKYR